MVQTYHIAMIIMYVPLMPLQIVLAAHYFRRFSSYSLCGVRSVMSFKLITPLAVFSSFCKVIAPVTATD
jgi:hypothetical protein